ncbi:MAG TPA: TetR/AcrR family transcriptional regulator [Spirochaetota bacterium]|nr:TetR/AcrR family transcriptional regulator [Spirochaetota bacterium]
MKYKKVFMKKRILKGATTVFLRHGYRGATMRKIADACNMPFSSIQYYYAQKQDIFSDVCEPARRNTAHLLDMLARPTLENGCVSSCHIAACTKAMQENLQAHNREIQVVLTAARDTKYSRRKYEITAAMKETMLRILNIYTERCGGEVKLGKSDHTYLELMARMVVEFYAVCAEKYKPQPWVYNSIYKTIHLTYDALWGFIKGSGRESFSDKKINV